MSEPTIKSHLETMLAVMTKNRDLRATTIYSKAYYNGFIDALQEAIRCLERNQDQSSQ